VLRVLESDERAAAAQLRLETAATEPVVAEVSHAGYDGTELPRDHPAWIKDAVAVSRAAREIVARLRPVAVRVFTFWDHRLRSIVAGGCRVHVDASGSYRL
jgi:sugar phosphate isomerase/epimerase